MMVGVRDLVLRSLATGRAAMLLQASGVEPCAVGDPETARLSPEERLVNLLTAVELTGAQRFLAGQVASVGFLQHLNRIVLFGARWPQFGLTELRAGRFRMVVEAFSGDRPWMTPRFRGTYTVRPAVSTFLRLLLAQASISADRFKLLADAYMGLLVIHPFADGNGRSLFVFIRALARTLYDEDLPLPLDLRCCRIPVEFREQERACYEEIVVWCRKTAVSHSAASSRHLQRRLGVGDFPPALVLAASKWLFQSRTTEELSRYLASLKARDVLHGIVITA